LPGLLPAVSAAAERSAMAPPQDQAPPALVASIDAHGTYRLGLSGASAPTLVSGVAARVDGRWLRVTDYPACRSARSSGQGPLGAANVWAVTCSGLSGAPELAYRLRVYAALPFADLTA